MWRKERIFLTCKWRGDSKDLVAHLPRSMMKTKLKRLLWKEGRASYRRGKP